MLHNEARNLLVKAYEKTHDAKAVALAGSVVLAIVYFENCSNITLYVTMEKSTRKSG